MNYRDTLEYLYTRLPVYQNIGASAYKEGLDNSLALDKYFGHPHTKYKTIHVAGTNGKGSTSHLLAAILQQSGYKVGLYTSPHLVDFRERIRVNGEKVNEAYVVDFVNDHKAFFEPVSPSFFELTMMMAFRYFADTNVDVAIIEVGLGGRLDSTNIITPDLCVITNISLDHTQFLGDTLEKIASEKAGIIKQNIPVVIGEAEGTVRNVFEDRAKSVGSSVTFAEDQHWILFSKNIGGKQIIETKEYDVLLSELAGEFQLKNAATVLTSIDILKSLGYHISSAAVHDGFAHVCSITGFMGRWQVLKNNPKVICDTGHNIAGIEYVVKQLASESYDRLHIVLGMVNDKDISKILSVLPVNANYYFTQASIARALDAFKLSEQASMFGLQGEAFSVVVEAVAAALKNAGEKDIVFIGGSNFVVGEALPMFF